MDGTNATICHRIFHCTANFSIINQLDCKWCRPSSTEKQKDLGNILVAELLQMGIQDAHLDEFGYIYATIPSNTDKDVPVICLDRVSGVVDQTMAYEPALRLIYEAAHLPADFD